jgi:hypothetical protein
VEKISSWTNALLLVGDWNNFLNTQIYVDAAHNISERWGKNHPLNSREVTT